MNVEIRAVHKEEMVEFRRLTQYVFADNDGDPTDEQNSLVIPDWTTCAFVDGRLASTAAAYPFRMRLNGAAVDTAGLTAVGTLPEFRRRGLLRRTIAQTFREQRERGQSIAILWASYGAIYQRFGYGPATNTISYEFDPRWAALRPGLESDGSVTSSSDCDAVLPTLEKIYRTWSAPRNLVLHRSAPAWKFGVLMAFDKKRKTHVAVYHNAAGEATGYLVYNAEGRDQQSPNQRLFVRDFVALDVDAHIGMWSYLLAHDLVFQIAIGMLPEDDPTPLFVTESRKLGRRLWDGLYLRVVDAERALALRPYGDSGRLVVEVRGDELCDWNEGRYRIDSDGGSADVARTEETPDLTLSPRSLAILMSGHTSATELARARLLDARDASVLRRADRLFATDYRPFCPDGF